MALLRVNGCSTAELHESSRIPTRSHHEDDDAQQRILQLQVNWQRLPEAGDIAVAALTSLTEKDRPGLLIELSTSRSTFVAVVIALLH